MPIDDEELVQFLLGEADVAMRSRVQASLAADPRVVQRLHELRAALGLLDSLKSSVEPPEDLVSRTLERIADAADRDPAEIDPAEINPAEIDAAQIAGAQRQPFASQPVEARRPSNCMSAGSAAQPGVALHGIAARKLRSGGVWDSAILSVSLAALACLLLPLVLQARFDSRRLQCAHNLKILGQGLTQLAFMDPQRRFPSVPISGKYAFAGLYSMRLDEAGLLPTSACLKCVSIPDIDGTGSHLICVPSSQQFSQADEAQQSYWRAQLGGNYAYNLGVFEQGRVMGPRLQGRSHFAILADAPMYDDDREVFQAHEGRGINLFYEDGHVAFVGLAAALPSEFARENFKAIDAASSEDPLFGEGKWSQAVDHPFRNLRGQHAAGLTPDDASLGPSYSTPRPLPIRR